MSSRIASTLHKLFDKHRLIFWYDAKKEMRAEFDSLQLDAVEKMEISNNEFGLKHRVLKQEPEQKFLIYKEGAKPEAKDNWLLDLVLAHTEFHADQEALLLADFGLAYDFADVIREHKEFFAASARQAEFKKRLEKDETRASLTLKMLAVVAGADSRIDAILEKLLEELALEKEDKFKLLQRCNLSPVLWSLLKEEFSYDSSSPGLNDFALSLFKACYALEMMETAKLNSEALVFFKRWRDSRVHSQHFRTLSLRIGATLNIEEDLHHRDHRKLLPIDFFQSVDKKIIHSLIGAVVGKSISQNECLAVIQRRQHSFWFSDFADIYGAIKHGVMFLHQLRDADFHVRSLTEAFRSYESHWYKLDLSYRKFCQHLRSSGQVTLLQSLADEVNRHYATSYLLKLNDNWQKKLDEASSWTFAAEGVRLQSGFYSGCVQDYMKRYGSKVCVIISDAMRYEVAAELLDLIRTEDRMDGSLEALWGSLPSYTQLGMASLLPHDPGQLSWSTDAKTVLLDGKSTMGMENRSAIIADKRKGRGKAIGSEEFSLLNKDAARDLVKEIDVLYIYHNRIDATGDKRDTEERVFEACEQTLEELSVLVKKLMNGNFSNILITADHGFLYQDQKLVESDFIQEPSFQGKLLYRNRRFLIGEGLNTEDKRFMAFNCKQLGMSGEHNVLIPKSINRLRQQGSGAQFVHGGSSLQEIVIPVLHINRKRQSTVSQVDVDIIQSGNQVISTGQCSVTLYQNQASTDKLQGRNLRLGIYSRTGELISDRHECRFLSTSENPRDREQTVRFLLSKAADAYNNKEVELRLEERIGDTEHYQTYKSLTYQLRRSFTSDFDL